MKTAIMQLYGRTKKWVLDEVRVEYLSDKYYQLEADGYVMIGVEVKP